MQGYRKPFATPGLGMKTKLNITSCPPSRLWRKTARLYATAAAAAVTAAAAAAVGAAAAGAAAAVPAAAGVAAAAVVVVECKKRCSVWAITFSSLFRL